ncbi:hypothetical protein VaNZ11_000187 [Volvox africanus]|uniref:Potassium channel domain-containing protein n=1 Tax=Volvox africanus TaxID=51714 RepID=A0ABQ5RLG8_9CHLO|nr:hypothetical protein VaNZ11_000187 [Volvox africanus]
MPSPSSNALTAARQSYVKPYKLRHVNVNVSRPQRCYRQAVAVAFRNDAVDGRSSTIKTTIERTITNVVTAIGQGFARLGGASLAGIEVRLLLQVSQVVASLFFVGLYIWSTYEPAARGSWRFTADLALSTWFAVDLAARIKAAGSSWLRMLLSPLSLVDVLSFAPGLLELCGAGWLGMGLQGVRLDLRWFRIFRALRLLRLCLLTGNLPLMKLSRSALLSGAVNVRLMQLVASVLALLFTSASLVHAVERLSWHDALYFVTTTLTTVGYGDVVVKTMAGRLIVLVFMAVGMVLIPVRTSQLWAQLASRRLTAGTLAPGRPVVLLSSRLTEVRGFADLTEEFFHQVQHQHFVPHDVHLMVLGNKPSYEFVAFQELHEQRITLVEGSVLRAADLARCRAEAAAAVLVLGDRFVNDAEAEDLDVLFRVWAIKSYTKCVPLTVQVLRASSLAKVAPFLDPHQDVIMSVQQMRHRLLALSALCPGASTLLGNLLHTAQPSRDLQESVYREPGSHPPKLAGRSWFAEYVRGCGHDLHLVAVRSPGLSPRGPGGGSRAGGTDLVGCSFGSVVSAAFQKCHLLVIGVLAGDGFGRLALNPPHSRRLGPADQLLVIAHSEQHAESVRRQDVVQSATAATRRAEKSSTTAAASAAANTASMTPEAGADFGGASPPGNSGGVCFGASDAEAVMEMVAPSGPASGRSGGREHAAAAAATTVAPKIVAPSAAAGTPRVKRYFPFLASWDEDMAPDGCYQESDGSSCPAQQGDAMGSSRSGSPNLTRAIRGCSSSASGSISEDDATVSADAGESEGGQDTRMAGLESSGAAHGVPEADACQVSADRPKQRGLRSIGSNTVAASSSPRLSGKFISAASSEPTTARGGSGECDGISNDSRKSRHSSSTRITGDIHWSATGSSLDSTSGSNSVARSASAAVAGMAPPHVGFPGGARGGTRSGGVLGGVSTTGGSAGGSSAVFASPDLDQPVIPMETDIGAAHTPAVAAPSPSQVVSRSGSSGSSGNVSFSSPPAKGSRAGSNNNGSSSYGSGSGRVSGGAPGSPSPGYISAATASAVRVVGQHTPNPVGRPYALVDAPWRQPDSSCVERRGHIILAGAIDSFVEFARVLHSCAGMRDPNTGISSLEVVVLHPNPPESTVLALGAMGPTRVVRGSPADPRALQQAGAAQARCLVYLGHSERPAGSRSSDGSSDSAASAAADYGSTSQAGVQADAEALLTCYGVGEESAPTISEESVDECAMTAEEWARLPLSPPYSQVGVGAGAGTDTGGGPYASGAVRGHSVVELSFTSSVRFLQPGLLLQGTSVWDESCSIAAAAATPRRSWRQRREAELAAAHQGLVQWQTNIYYGAGRVVVPALVDTFTIQAFAKRNLLLDVMSELCGDDGRPQGTPLRQLPVPRELAGRPYRELFDALVSHGSVPLGLYRSKSENPAWRLHYVSTNPAWEEVVSSDDKVFVLRPAD